MLWLGIRIERLLGDKDAEASYAMLLRRKYPNSEQTKALLSGQ
jgi:type IV pilus assembly protein PilF